MATDETAPRPTTCIPPLGTVPPGFDPGSEPPLPDVGALPAPLSLAVVVTVAVVGEGVRIDVQYPFTPHFWFSSQHSFSQQLPESGQAPLSQHFSVSRL